MTMTDQTTQWEDIALADHTYIEKPKPGFQEGRFSEEMSSCEIQFYTGLPLIVFKSLVQALSSLTQGTLQMFLEDKLLLVLLRLRLGLMYEDLARRFNISVSRVCVIFNEMLQKLKEVREDVAIWLPR